MCGLSFATGAGRELGMEEPCQLFVYNSIVRLRQSEVYEVVQKFQSLFFVLLPLRDLLSMNSFCESSCVRLARSDYRHSYIYFEHRFSS